MNTSKISFEINPIGDLSGIKIQVCVNNVCIFQSDAVNDLQTISHEINDDDEQEHELQIVMQGKTPGHTEIDDAGNIIRDSMLNIQKFDIDDLDVNKVFLEKAVYTHDFNGTQDQIQDTFYGHMGCNGTISLKFTTPVYLWLLENM